jgi:hypothetical protein
MAQNLTPEEMRLVALRTDAKGEERATPLRWAAISLVYFAGTLASLIVDEAVTQPHPVYLEGNWLTNGIRGSFSWALLVSASIAVVLIIGVFSQTWPADTAFYPTFADLRKIPHLVSSRMVVSSGILLVAGYWAWTALAVWEGSLRPHGLLWPPHWFFASTLYLWNVFWLAGCLTRPRFGTLVASLVFSAWTTIATIPLAYGMVRE